MYPPKYVRYLNLPVIPDSVIKNLVRDYSLYEKKVQGTNYIWTDSYNSELNAWCKQNICDDMYFAFQIISGDMLLHKDQGTKTKLIYLLDAGGTDVWTEFYSDDKITVLQKEKLVENRWQIMKVDVYHRVVGVDPSRTRFSVTGRIFE